MSPETPRIPLRWFVIAGVFAIVLAAIAATLVLQPVPNIRNSIVPFLQQTTPDGRIIAWGDTVIGNSVNLGVTDADDQRYTGADLFLAHGDEAAVPVKHKGFGAELKQLSAGRYRWSARLRLNDNKAGETLEPPRADPRAADFIVSPRSLALSDLAQSRLDGSSIGSDLRTEDGALLATWTDYPGAALEVEVKAASGPFDGTQTQQTTAVEGAARVTFLGADGPYHWRARLNAADAKSTEWKEYRTAGGKAAFIIYHRKQASNSPSGDSDAENQSSTSDGEKAPQKDAGKGPDNSKRESGADAKSKADGRAVRVVSSTNVFSSGLAGGSREPLPSRVKPLLSLWDLAIFRTMLMLGGAISVLGAVFLLGHWWKGRAKRDK